MEEHFSKIHFCASEKLLGFVFMNLIMYFDSETSKKRTKTVVNSNNPSWNQTFVYPRIRLEDLRSRVIEVTVWDYDRFGSNEFLGEVLIELTNIALIQQNEEALWHYLNLHESVGGELTTVPPICPTPGLMVRTFGDGLMQCCQLCRNNGKIFYLQGGQKFFYEMNCCNSETMFTMCNIYYFLRNVNLLKITSDF